MLPSIPRLSEDCIDIEELCHDGLSRATAAEESLSFMEQCVRRKFGTAVGSYIVAEYRSRVTPDTALALCELVSYEAPSVDLCSHNDVLVRATTAPS